MKKAYENHYCLYPCGYLNNRLCFTTSASHDADTTQDVSDEHGKYNGRVDASGRIFNEHSRYEGRIDTHGRVYKELGRYEGVVNGEIKIIGTKV